MYAWIILFVGATSSTDIRSFHKFVRQSPDFYTIERSQGISLDFIGFRETLNIFEYDIESASLTLPTEITNTAKNEIMDQAVVGISVESESICLIPLTKSVNTAAETSYEQQIKFRNNSSSLCVIDVLRVWLLCEESVNLTIDIQLSPATGGMFKNGSGITFTNHIQLDIVLRLKGEWFIESSAIQEYSILFPYYSVVWANYRFSIINTCVYPCLKFNLVEIGYRLYHHVIYSSKQETSH